MQPRYDGAYFPKVHEVATAVKINGHYFMQGHLKYVLCFLAVYVHSNDLLDMVSKLQNDEPKYTLARIWMLIRIVLGTKVEIACATQQTWKKLRIMEDDEAPNADRQKV